MKTSLLFLMAGLVAPQSGFTQSASFNYQGGLSDNGAPANGTYNLRMTLHDAANGGSQIGPTLTNSAIVIAGGLFNVTLDFGASAFDGGQRWLEIAVRTNGSLGAFTTLSPRQFVSATPYALHAANAAVANSVSATNLTDRLPDVRLSTNVALLNANASFSDAISASAFIGNGAGLSNIAGTLRWQIVSGSSQLAQPNHGYLLTSESKTIVTLPVTANAGDVIRVSAPNGPWRVTQNAGQVIVGARSGTLGVTNLSWTPHETNRYWSAVASSADGSKLVAVDGEHVSFPGRIYTSTDFGTTWAARETNSAWGYVASSADGTRLVATVWGGQIYTSTDCGVTWTARDEDREWSGVASSADGNRLVAITYGDNAYVSSDAGTNWTALQGPEYWLSVASSADGTRIVAIAAGLIAGDSRIYTSDPADLTLPWTRRATDIERGWAKVSSSADGNRLLALVDAESDAYPGSGTGVFVSTNGGDTWSLALPTAVLASDSVVSSADGTRLFAARSMSIDGGRTWRPYPLPPVNFEHLACSADGTKLLAAGFGSRLFTADVALFCALTTVGSAGFLSGPAGSAIELQCSGNNQFMVLSHEGTILGH